MPTTSNVVFVAPYFGPTMTRVLRALVDVPDTKVGVITQVPEDRLPKGLRIAGHYAVDDALDAGQLKVAARAFQKEWGRVDRLVGYLEHMQLPLAEAREALGIVGIHGDVARNFRDKNRMKRVLAAAGLPVAKQALVDGMVSALKFVEDVGFPVIIKPVDGVGSKDTYRVRDEDELFAVLNQLAPSPTRPVQCEQFVVGEEHTCETVLVEGKPVWQSSTYYLPGPLKVLENPWMQYCVLLPKEQHEAHVKPFLPVNAAALRALGLVTGFSHMEWFLRDDGVQTIGEVGARPAGVNIMAMNGFAHDVDVWAKWVELEVKGRFEMPARKYACGCAFIRGHGPGRVVRGLVGLEETFAKLKGHIVDHQLPTKGAPRSAHYEGDGWIIVRHETTEGAVEALRTVVTGIEVQYA